ncbi:MAG: hypothetical protein JWP94_2863 [Mucilaginibacter sp.]|nr:hypothetical protein [Mucilaginibacter sp.]
MLTSRRTKAKIKKSIALLLLFSIINQLFVPGIAYALTAGPTAPEATNFEPIDTTDMVNPLTGDFTYGLPVIDVPGPEGDYPLALSYHAGIQPNEDASWVGLGWSLNPGAIARNVNGYPDDWQAQSATTGSYWSGGTTKTIGVNIGLSIDAASVSVGLSFAQDTYKGFGVGFSISGGLGIGGTNSPFFAGATVGVNPYGGAYVGLGIGAGMNISKDMGLSGSVNVGIQYNFDDKKINAGVGGGIGAGSKYKGIKSSMSLLGASISTDASNVSLSVGGGESWSANNANAGKIQTDAEGWSITLPIPLISIGVSYSVVRYWSDETAGVTVNGVLNDHASINASSDMNTTDDDNYNLLDPLNYNIIDNPNPATQLGGTFPDFDNYCVTAQGLSGYMRPYNFATVLYGQNQTNNTDHSNDVVAEVRSTSGTTNAGWQFRFINDFSNYYGQSSPWSSDNVYSFDQTAQYGNNDGTYGYDPATNRLEGSKHIEYFTNNQIISGAAAARGFVDCQGTQTGGFTRRSGSQMGSQIGGFMITNASGVTYHYALPVYSSNETVYTQKIDQSQGLQTNTLIKSVPYAYTWYLTAITGPDYVPRGSTPGIIDPSDWGYWVKFDYGEWSKSYQWRNPSEGFNRDLDNQFESYSTGVKEIYYLDAIETRSHTAIFEKQIRADGKSILGTNSNGATLYQIQQSAVCDNNGTGCTPSYSYPVPTLALKDILLFQNDQLTMPINQLRSNSECCSGYRGIYSFSAQTSNSDGSHNAIQTDVFDADNVIDTYDIAYTSGFTNKCLRKVAFNYDYSLCPGVPNSFDQYGSNYTANPSTTTQPDLGKLTLLSVEFQGKGGVNNIVPPVQFQYDLDPNDPANQDFITLTEPASNLTGTIQTQNTGTFRAGDIMSFPVNGVTYYCVLLSTTDNTNFNVRYLNSSPPGTPSNVLAVKTKNPPYNKDAYDLWECYKSDYANGSANENLARMTTPVSNKSTDVWSLRNIHSSLGANIKINYEGDTYNRAVLNQHYSLIVNQVTRNSAQNYTLQVNNENLDLTTMFQNGNRMRLLLLKQATNTSNQAKTYSTISSDTYTDPVIVTSVSSSQINITVGQQMDQDISNPPANSTAYIATGNIISSGYNLFYGGGLRVNSILVDDLNGHIHKTGYDYGLLGSPAGQVSSSGVTSYQPGVFDADGAAPYGTAATSTYRRVLYGDYNYLLSIAREVPAPGVMYENVAIAESTILPTGQVIPVEGKTVYQYEVFRPEMLNVYPYYNKKLTAVNQQQNIGGTNYYIANYSRKNMAIKDYSSRVGNLRRIITYDNLGNKVSEKINHYLNDDLDNTSFGNQVKTYEPRLLSYNGINYNNMGVIKERYGNARLAVATVDNNKNPTSYNDLLLMSNKETFPSIQTGVTQYDYKNGTKTEQQNLAYDFYTATVTKTLSIDSYGNRFINQMTPAYMVGGGSSYPALGLKTHDDDQGTPQQHKQMLTQAGSNYTFSVDANNNPIGVVTATVQTWSNSIPVLDQNGNPTTFNQANIWRMEKSYSWLASGTTANNVTPYSSFVDYYAPGGSTNASWKKTGQITQYNVYSSALEASDINNNYAATRMGYNNGKVLITGGPAKYNEIAYAGAEDAMINGNFSNNISPGGGTVTTDSVNSHTGIHSLMVPANTNGFTYTVPLTNLSTTPQNYSVVVWVKPSNGASANQTNLYYQVGGGTVVSPPQTYSKTAAGWYLLEMTVPASAITGSGNLVVGCRNSSSASVYFDDFRFQPVAAATTAYVYDTQTGELSYILGNNNLYVRYQYDAIGRLVRTYKEVIGKTNIPLIKAVAYNYATITYHNHAKSQIFTNQNCGSGYPQPITYTVPANTYSSTTSQAAADQLAQNDVNANGQTYANNNGPCYVGVSMSNSVSVAGFQARFSNNATGVVSYYNFLTNGTTTYAIPPGTYTVSINPVNTSVSHTFSLGNGNRPSQTAPGATFSNVNISIGSADNSISIQ